MKYGFFSHSFEFAWTHWSHFVCSFLHLINRLGFLLDVLYKWFNWSSTVVSLAFPSPFSQTPGEDEMQVLLSVALSFFPFVEEVAI